MQESAWPAAKTRLLPRFRGHLDEAGYAFSWKSCTETLRPISPINTPAEQQRGGIQRLKLGFFFRSFSLYEISCIFRFCYLKKNILKKERSFVIG